MILSVCLCCMFCAHLKGKERLYDIVCMLVLLFEGGFLYNKYAFNDVNIFLVTKACVKLKRVGSHYNHIDSITQLLP